MADNRKDRKVVVSHSVLNSLVVDVKVRTHSLPSTSKYQNPNTQWKPGISTPIKHGIVSPNTGAIGLLTGFATGQVSMEGDVVKHLPSTSESLNEINWETPKCKNVNGEAL